MAGNTIGKILKNEFYLGTLVQGKTRTIDATVKENIKIDSSEWYRHKNNHEAIIEEDIFYEVNKKIKERGMKAKKANNIIKLVLEIPIRLYLVIY